MLVGPGVDRDEALAGAHIVFGGGGAARPLVAPQSPQVPLETIVERMMTVVWPGLQRRLAPDSDSPAASRAARRSE